MKGVKLRKSSSVPEEKKSVDEGKATAQSESVKTNVSSTATSANGSKSPATTSVNTVKPPAGQSTSKPGNTLSLGLGYASSDDED